jgi:hypothetical protein
MIARVEANEASFTDLQPGDTNTDYLSLVIEHNAEIIISLWIYLHFLLPCAIEDWPAFIWSVY